MSGSLIYHRQKIAKLTFRAFSPVSAHHHLEASFSKVSNLFGLISGAIIPFTSLQRRDSKPSNFAIHLVFLTLKKNVKRPAFQHKRDFSLTTGFSGTKSSRDFRETGYWKQTGNGSSISHWTYAYLWYFTLKNQSLD